MWKTGNRNVEPAELPNDGAWTIEQKDVRVPGKKTVWNRGAFVVPGNDENWQSVVRQRFEGREGPLHELGRNPAPVEDIAAVHDHVHLATPGRFEGSLEIREEIVAPPASAHPRTKRQVEAQMGVGQKEDLDEAHARNGDHTGSFDRAECYNPPFMPRGKLFTPRFFLMCGFTFSVFISAFMLFPTAPFHILDLGGSKVTAGLFLGFLTYASALSAPFTGALADRLGKRRMLLTTSTALAAFSMLYAVSPSYVWMLVLVPVHGVVWSGLLTASAAYLIDQIPPSRRAEGLAWWGLATVAAIAVAPTIAFWVYNYGWFWVCTVSGFLNLVMAFIAFRLEESPLDEAMDSARGVGGLARFVEWRVLILSVTLFLFSFGYGGITSFVALYAESSGTSKSLYFTVFAVTILLTRPIIGTLADRVGHKRVLAPCLGLTAVGLALLVPGGSVPWLVASGVVFGLGLGSAFPVFSAYVMQHVSTSRRGAAFGGVLAAFDMGIGTGSMVLGYVIEIFDFATAFGVAAALAVLSLPYFVIAEGRLFGGWRSSQRNMERRRSSPTLAPEAELEDRDAVIHNEAS